MGLEKLAKIRVSGHILSHRDNGTDLGSGLDNTGNCFMGTPQAINRLVTAE